MSLVNSALPVLPAVTDTTVYNLELQPASNTRTNALYIAPALQFTPATSLLSTRGNVTAYALTVNSAVTVGTTLSVVGNVVLAGSIVSNLNLQGNILSNARIGFTWANNTSSSYTVFNSATNSVDLIFG